MVLVREARRAIRRLAATDREPLRDTTPAAEQVRVEAIRRTDPSRRLREALDLSETTRAVALSRLRAIHPGRSDLELVELMLGRTLVPRGSAGRA